MERGAGGQLAGGFGDEILKCERPKPPPPPLPPLVKKHNPIHERIKPTLSVKIMLSKRK